MALTTPLTQTVTQETTFPTDTSKSTSSTFNLAGLQSASDVAATTPTAASAWNVDPKTQTVAGQLENVLASDNPLMQQARTRAQQGMNQRGLMNSSMATSAADAAMYDTALKIAQPDAATNATAAQQNTAATNQFAAADNAVKADAAKQNATAQNTFASNYNQFQYDAAKTGLQTQAAINIADIEAQYKNLTQGSAAATSILSKMQDSINSVMANTSISDKQAAINDIRANTVDAMNLIGAIAGDKDLAQFITAISS